jgi:hypothetical protein
MNANWSSIVAAKATNISPALAGEQGRGRIQDAGVVRAEL